jgi:hypothetical protein
MLDHKVKSEKLSVESVRAHHVLLTTLPCDWSIGKISSLSRFLSCLCSTATPVILSLKAHQPFFILTANSPEDTFSFKGKD